MIDNKVEEIRKHFDAIMDVLGIERTQSNEGTPLRVAKMYANEIFRNRNNLHIDELDATMKMFTVDDYAVQTEHERCPIVVKSIPFWSTCEHHFMPFGGVAKVTYVPGDQIIGLSKIPRVVEFFSKKPQLQERLTHEIGEYLLKIMKPVYLKVELECTHTCVMCRGVEKYCETVTVFERGRK